MKKTYPFLLLVCFLLAVSTSQARTFYVKHGGLTTTSGLSDAAAWNLQALNNRVLSAGDTVLFRRGDTFFGELKVCGGSAGRPVVYGAYGHGKNPVFSGFVSVTSWNLHSGNIWYTDLSAFRAEHINLITLDSTVVGMGRHPNSGYLPYTGHTGRTAISGTSVGTLPFNAAGAEVVMRKVRWIIDRHPVTSHTGNTLYLGSTSVDGGYLGYEPVDKNGYFIQNHLGTLDKEGEWYYDRVTRRLYMHLSGPTKRVRVAVVDKLVSISSKSNITFTDLDFEGSSTHAASISGGANISFQRCRFYQHGQTALYGIGVTNISVDGGLVQHCLNNGIWVEYGGSGTVVQNVTVNNIGTIAGAGRSGDGAQQGISIHGENTTVRHCYVSRTGYNGINFDGNNALIEYNKVDSFCLVKDDGGGIYTFENDGVEVWNRIVRNNIILNAIGAYPGSEAYYYEPYGKAAGIYLDGFSNHTKVESNVIANGSWAGYFVHNNSNNQFISNLVFNHQMSILLLESTMGAVRNNVIMRNECIARGGNQKTLYVTMFVRDNPKHFGSFEGNTYARPVDDNQTITVDRQFNGGGGPLHLSLEQWISNYGQDLTSSRSKITTGNTTNIHFDYNHTTSPKVVTLKGSWKDIHSTVYQNSLTIPSFRGKVILSTASGSGDGFSLPVKESSFIATREGRHVLLTWKAIGETDAYFDVERSADGSTFHHIGRVAAQSSLLETAYAFNDKQPFSPINYYRLKTVDNKGSSTYSKIISIRMTEVAQAAMLYPNPAANSITLTLPTQQGEQRLMIHDMGGRIVKSANLPQGTGPVHHKLDITDLKKGSYALSTGQQTLLFIKQ